MASGNFNMEDPAKQEQIRRGHHEYVPTAGKHGTYVPKPYRHQEYPKMMAKIPQPQRKDFAKTEAGVIVSNDVADANYQAAMVAWNQAMESSVVKNAAEEKEWLRQNG